MIYFLGKTMAMIYLLGKTMTMIYTFLELSNQGVLMQVHSQPI